MIDIKLEEKKSILSSENKELKDSECCCNNTQPCTTWLRLTTLWVFFLLMPCALVTIGAILGHMNLKYHEVNCLYEKDGFVMVHEPNTNVTFPTSLSFALPEDFNLPIKCWTDAKYTVFFNPTTALEIFVFTWSALEVFLVLIILLFYLKKLIKCCSCSKKKSCVSCIKVLLYILLFLMVIAALLGGLIMGLKSQKYIVGTCLGYYPVRYENEATYEAWGSLYNPYFNTPKYDIYYIESLSPMPTKLPTDCWSDGETLTFINPRYVLATYFIVWSTITVFIILSLLVLSCYFNNSKKENICTDQTQDPPKTNTLVSAESIIENHVAIPVSEDNNRNNDQMKVDD